MNILDDLNEKQRDAVLETEGYVRVIAGAGSGKTKLLVSRYVYLVEEYGIDPANILCVTFTNKAAGEMKKRIRALIGSDYDTTLICTYHGFCARLLRENPEKLFLSKGFQIIDTAQQKAILEDIYQKHELKLDHASYESMLKKIAKIKSTTDYVSKFCNPEPCQIMPSITSFDDELIEEFMQRQKAIYSLDFNDLMSFALYLLETDDEIKDKWQDRLNYIQVDEFQDSSTRELQLVDILSGKYKNLMIVGDPDQNIYEWRGSDVKLLVDFDHNHRPTKTIILNQNYRSTPQILRCANHLIEKNELRLKKDLFTKSENGAFVTHYHSKSDDEENETIVNNIRRLKKEFGYSYSDFAVLYRSGFLSRVIEKKFVERNMPYEIFGGVKFYQRMEILDIVAYLRVIEFDDDVSLKRIINTPRRKFGRAKMAYLEQLKEEKTLFDDGHEKSLFETLKFNLYNPMFASSGAPEFVEFVESIKRFAPTANIYEIVNRVAEESGYEQYIRELGDEERLENLSEFKRIANEFERSFGEKLTLSEFLQQIALQSYEDEEKPKEAVKLMTIHAAKGLEFPVVFIVGMTEGIFPSSKTIEERKMLGLEEERRLCYVAITRAKQFLFIMDSEGYSEKGIKKLPSRFLTEIGAKNYTRIGFIPDDLMREARRFIKKNTPVSTSDFKSQMDIGDSVEHSGFGHGTIVGIDGLHNSYIIQFDKLSHTRNISQSYFEKERDGLTIPIETNKVPIVSSIEENDKSPIENLVDKYYDAKDPDYIDFDDDSSNTTFDYRLEEIREIYRDNYDETDDGSSQNSEEFVEESFVTVNTDEPPQTISDELREKMANTPNLWKRDDAPHSGWSCVGVTDLGSPCGVCEMCGYQIIRYVHHMVHPNYNSLNVGCVCAGKMEGDIAAAKRREQSFKNKQSRYENFRNKKWKQSRNGNSYLTVKEHIVIIYKTRSGSHWKYSIDREYCDDFYDSKEQAISAAFEALDKKIYRY